MSRWIRTSEAAALLGVSESTVRRMAEAGIIPTRRRHTTGEWRLYDRQTVLEMAELHESRAQHGTLLPSRHDDGAPAQATSARTRPDQL